MKAYKAQKRSMWFSTLMGVWAYVCVCACVSVVHRQTHQVMANNLPFSCSFLFIFFCFAKVPGDRKQTTIWMLNYLRWCGMAFFDTYSMCVCVCAGVCLLIISWTVVAVACKKLCNNDPYLCFLGPIFTDTC